MQLWNRLQWELGKARLHFKLADSLRSTRALQKQRLILFHVPEAWVRPHLALLSVLAKTLMERGHNVAMVRCYGLFDRCPVKDMRNLPANTSPTMHDQICIHCATHSFNFIGAYGLNTIDLRAYATPALKAIIDTELGRLPHSLLYYEYNHIPIGRIAASQVALLRKAFRLETPSETTRKVWKEYIQTALTTYLLMSECLKHHEAPTLLHYNDYVTAVAARLAVRAHGGTTIGISSAIHKNVDRRRPTFFQNIAGTWLSEQYHSWEKRRGVAVSPHFIHEIGDDSLTNFTSHGIHIFSPQKVYFDGDFRTQIGIDPQKKLVVAFTSSTDEMVARRHLMQALKIDFFEPAQPFKDQVEWLKALCDFAAARSDCQVWVRIHPREGANARNPVSSEHLAILRDHFSTPSPNIKFVWPEDTTSSYDLAEIADLALTSWSSLGLEMGRLGVPVLATTNNEMNPVPVGGFIEWVDNQPDYFSKIDTLLRTPHHTSLDTITRAFRWYYWSRLAHSIDLSDVIPNSDYTDLPEFRLPKHAQDIEGVIVNHKAILDVNRARETHCATHSFADERAAIEGQLRRFIHYFFTGENYTPNTLDAIIDGQTVTYRHQAASRAKYSPLISRLIGILRGQNESDLCA